MQEDRTALVVGGAGGIGSAVCKRFAQEEYKVYVVDIDLARAEALAAALPGTGHRAYKIDVIKPDDVEACFDLVEKESPAAVLVVVSGGTLVNPAAPPNVAEMSVDEWDRTIALNVSGVFHCVGKFARQRLASPLDHSRIILFSSGSGQLGGTPVGIAYVSAKAGIIGFTRQAAAELASAKITVNCIAPGPVATEEFLRAVSPENRAAMAPQIPLNCFATPEQIAAGVAYLASEDAAYVTGTTLDINGGAHMH